jgi:hypothetical protein
VAAGQRLEFAAAFGVAAQVDLLERDPDPLKQLPRPLAEGAEGRGVQLQRGEGITTPIGA